MANPKKFILPTIWTLCLTVVILAISIAGCKFQEIPPPIALSTSPCPCLLAATPTKTVYPPPGSSFVSPGNPWFYSYPTPEFSPTALIFTSTPSNRFYRDPAGLFELEYPFEWAPTPDGAADRWRGYFRVHYLPEMGSHSSVYQVILDLGNRDEGPTHNLSVGSLNNSISAGWMSPLYGQQSDAMFVIFETNSKRPEFRYVQLEISGPDHQGISSSLRLTLPPDGSQALDPGPPAGIPWPTKPHLPPGITIQEFPIGEEPEVSPYKDAFERDHLPASWFEQPETPVPTQSPAEQAAETRKFLAPFGYEWIKSETYPEFFELRRGSEVLLDKATDVFFLEPDQSGKDFMLLVNNRIYTYWVSKDGIHPYFSGYGNRYGPIQFQGEWILVDYYPSGGLARVLGKDQEFYRFAAPYLAGPPPISFQSWQSHWILEIDSFLIVDGKMLNRQLGVNEIFNVTFFQNKPVFFVSAGGQTGLVLGGNLTKDDPGTLLPEPYDEVFHGGCCGFGAQNPYENEHDISFFARRGTTWYEVLVVLSN